MRVLIDTHSLLWWIGRSELLNEDALDQIGNPENQIHYSAVSLWELHLKERVGKLRLPSNCIRALSDQFFVPVPLRPEHTAGIVDLPWHHRDPFDRMLVAQAQAEALTIFTADEHLAAYGEFVKVCKKRRGLPAQE